MLTTTPASFLMVSVKFHTTLTLQLSTSMSVVLLVFLVSGLSWAGIWGGKMVQAWSTFPAEKWDAVPLSDKTHADMNHAATKEVPWGLEQTPLPESGSTAGASGVDGASTTSMERGRR